MVDDEELPDTARRCNDVYVNARRKINLAPIAGMIIETQDLDGGFVGDGGAHVYRAGAELCLLAASTHPP